MGIFLSVLGVLRMLQVLGKPQTQTHAARTHTHTHTHTETHTHAPTHREEGGKGREQGRGEHRGGVRRGIIALFFNRFDIFFLLPPS